jgi:pimeloyl-ACP methyl ester carboxylesterase
MAHQRRTLDLDGRRIDYLEFGDPDGVPALHLHGTPSSAAAGAWLDAAGRSNAVRIVSPDRPGYLGSDVAADPSLLGASRELLAFARRLELGRFGVAAFSGGACWAFALAHLAPDEVTVVHVGGGLGSLATSGNDVLGRGKRLMFRAGSRPVVGPIVIGAPMGLMRLIIGRRLRESGAAAAEAIYGGAARGAQVDAVAAYIRDTPPDELSRELGDHLAAGSSKGVVYDLRAYVRPWPFALRELTTPIEIWHGLHDPAVPLGFARAAARELQHGNVHMLDGEGHFVFHTHADEIAASIREHA